MRRHTESVAITVLLLVLVALGLRVEADGRGQVSTAQHGPVCQAPKAGE